MPRLWNRNRLIIPIWAEALLLGGLGAIGRILPHSANFTPIMALALFCGFRFPLPVAIVIPVTAMLISDYLAGFYDFKLMLIIYAGLILPVLPGLFIKSKPGPVLLSVLALASGLIFFIVSNFGVWLLSGLYEHNFNGLTLCYAAGLPFWRNSLFGNLVWTAILFGPVAFMLPDRPASPLSASN